MKKLKWVGLGLVSVIIAAPCLGVLWLAANAAVNPTALDVAAIAPTETSAPSATPTATGVPSPTAMPVDPLTIAYLRQRDYPGSDITIEQTLAPGSNYSQYIASYRSDGLRIYALLTVPKGVKPATGFPAIVFNHGYIPPQQYHTTERYVAYVDAIARSGYIVFKPDYRGHGNSEGQATGGYGSPAYTIDVLNALTSIQHFADADPNRVGMWGHSMGGQITLRAMVVSKDIKAGVIWAGVVGSYPELMTAWHPITPIATPVAVSARRWRQDLFAQYGSPEQNPAFWASISPNSYVADLSGPLQLHHGTADEEVPLKFSQELYGQVKAAGKTVELYTYPGSNHNITQGFTLAMQRTIAFFDKYVK
ncbi:MAG: alpha/beta fold hydrolase [Chloroflexi bacterium]|nr:alpha/beta fold hydrolase [Chloroflexota bacterium]